MLILICHPDTNRPEIPYYLHSVRGEAAMVTISEETNPVEWEGGPEPAYSEEGVCEANSLTWHSASDGLPTSAPRSYKSTGSDAYHWHVRDNAVLDLRFLAAQRALSMIVPPSGVRL
jgi:hypothetical protein